MQRSTILAAAPLLAATPAALAEADRNLLQPTAIGSVTGNAEKDTIAYDVEPPSDLWVRFSEDCIVQAAAPGRTVEAAVAQPAVAIQ